MVTTEIPGQACCTGCSQIFLFSFIGVGLCVSRLLASVNPIFVQVSSRAFSTAFSLPAGAVFYSDSLMMRVLYLQIGSSCVLWAAGELPRVGRLYSWVPLPSTGPHACIHAGGRGSFFPTSGKERKLPLNKDHRERPAIRLASPIALAHASIGSQTLVISRSFSLVCIRPAIKAETNFF